MPCNHSITLSMHVQDLYEDFSSLDRAQKVRQRNILMAALVERDGG